MLFNLLLSEINIVIKLKFKEKYKVQHVAKSYEEVLHSDVDAVYLPIPHFLHYDYIKRALQNSKHVLTEKPLCLTVKEAEEVIALANKKGLILSVNFHNRYKKNAQKIIRSRYDIDRQKLYNISTKI